jgi:hypothetical protein
VRELRASKNCEGAMRWFRVRVEVRKCESTLPRTKKLKREVAIRGKRIFFSLAPAAICCDNAASAP